MTTLQPYITKVVFTLKTTKQLINNRLVRKGGNAIYALKFTQRIYIKGKYFVDAFKPHNRIYVYGGNVDWFVILQNMDIRWSNWAIYIEIIIPIWFIESIENTTTPFRCER